MNDGLQRLAGLVAFLERERLEIILELQMACSTSDRLRQVGHDLQMCACERDEAVPKRHLKSSGSTMASARPRSLSRLPCTARVALQADPHPIEMWRRLDDELHGFVEKSAYLSRQSTREHAGELKGIKLRSVPSKPGSSSQEKAQWNDLPPSAANVAPVTNEESVLVRNRITRAISSGLAIRFSA